MAQHPDAAAESVPLLVFNDALSLGLTLGIYSAFHRAIVSTMHNMDEASAISPGIMGDELTALISFHA